MSDIIFGAKGLTKQYKRFGRTSYPLNGIDMEIHKEDIYGFVGANGAGKTTLIRIMAGLVAQTQGNIELFGERKQEKLYRQRRRMNGIIEQPALDPALTAQDNLKICCIQRGINDRGHIGEVLETVGLSQQEIKGLKVKNFSLGMKQRLGVAKALLGNPEFLFFDEPLNGLDPTGIRDFREMVRTLHQRGITILISSHMLGELDQIATCYGFIHKGKILEQITAEDLMEKFNRYMLIRVDNIPLAERILREVFKISSYQVVSGDTIHLYEQLDKKAKIVKAFAIKEIAVEEVTIKGDDLEGYFMSLIQGKK